MKYLHILWKIPTVIVVSIIGNLFAMQTGWSFSYEFFHMDDGLVGLNIEHVLTLASGAVVWGVLWTVHRLARHALWLLVPLMVWAFLVGGVWNGYASDWDYERVLASYN